MSLLAHCLYCGEYDLKSVVIIVMAAIAAAQFTRAAFGKRRSRSNAGTETVQG